MTSRAAYIAGIANAQRVARDAILEVAERVRPGDTERAVAARIEAKLAAAPVHHWLHTAYAWWGERTRFDGFRIWEWSALPSERRLEEGQCFILDVAPIVDGFPADFAYSGIAGSAESRSDHETLLAELSKLKSELLGWAKEARSAAELCRRVAQDVRAAELDVIHTRYPAQVLGHTLEGFPNFFSQAPRIGSGFQIPLLLSYAKAIVLHHFAGAPYPFLNDGAPERPKGLFAVEPHLGRGALGAKFESVLLVDGDETRWLDPGLFGEVVG
ncbi:MAG TPA: M24 family metallopeptidase [Polyangiaceae bacterium]|nr:M24 family metallopeptidase [Polyangiaceae bacterium]